MITNDDNPYFMIYSSFNTDCHHSYKLLSLKDNQFKKIVIFNK
jgi:hypothetical protein